MEDDNLFDCTVIECTVLYKYILKVPIDRKRQLLPYPTETLHAILIREIYRGIWKKKKI